MKKIGFILVSMFLTAIVFQSCVDDQTATGDPRDAIAKDWRVTDDNGQVGKNGYDVTISKDGSDVTRILIDNFAGVTITVKATMASKIITINTQDVVDGTTTYTVEGEGVVSNDNENIKFEYSIDDGDGAVNVIAYFGPMPVVKKALVVASNN